MDLDTRGKTLQQYVVNRKYNDIETRLKRGMDPDSEVPVDQITHPRASHLVYGTVTMLQLACDLELRPLVLLLLKFEADPNKADNPTFPTPLQAACRWKRLPNGKVSYGHHGIASLLLQKQADPDGTASLADMVYTPLHLAVQNNNVELTKLLLDLGAEPAFGVKANLKYVACNRSVEVLELLLTNDSLAIMKANMDCPLTDVRKDRVLHLLVDHKWYNGTYCMDPPEARTDTKRQFTLIQTFISWGAIIDAQNFHGSTPLHIAWCQLNVNLSYALVKKFGANYKIKDNAGCPPFECHASGKNALLLSLSCECRFDEEEVKRVAFIFFLLDCGLDPTKTDRKKQNALHYFCKYSTSASSELEVLHGLIKKCKISDINKLNDYNETPLWLAATVAKDRDMVQLLLQYGANPDAICVHRLVVLQQLASEPTFPSIGWLAVDLCRAGAQYEDLWKDDDDPTPWHEAHVVQDHPSWLPFRQYLAGEHHGHPNEVDQSDYELSMSQAAANKRNFEKTFFESYLNGETSLPSVRLNHADKMARVTAQKRRLLHGDLNENADSHAMIKELKADEIVAKKVIRTGEESLEQSISGSFAVKSQRAHSMAGRSTNGSFSAHSAAHSSHRPHSRNASFAGTSFVSDDLSTLDGDDDDGLPSTMVHTSLLHMLHMERETEFEITLDNEQRKNASALKEASRVNQIALDNQKLKLDRDLERMSVTLLRNDVQQQQQQQQQQQCILDRPQMNITEKNNHIRPNQKRNSNNPINELSVTNQQNAVTPQQRNTTRTPTTTPPPTVGQGNGVPTKLEDILKPLEQEQPLLISEQPHSSSMVLPPTSTTPPLHQTMTTEGTRCSVDRRPLPGRPDDVIEARCITKDHRAKGSLATPDLMSLIADLHVEYDVPVPDTETLQSNLEWAMRRAGVNIYYTDILLEDCERIIACLPIYNVMNKVCVNNPKQDELKRFTKTDYDEIPPEQEHKYTYFPPLDVDTGEPIPEKEPIETGDYWEIRSDESYDENNEEMYMEKLKLKLKEERQRGTHSASVLQKTAG